MGLVASDGLAELINKKEALQYLQQLTVTKPPTGRPKVGPHQLLPSPRHVQMYGPQSDTNKKAGHL